MAGGSVGRGAVVDLSQGFHWTAPDWARRRLWAGASVTWAELAAAGRPFGLRLPPDPSSGAFATSGGMAATNAAGPRSVRCGSARSWIEAIEIIDAEGNARRIAKGAGSGERFVLSPDQRRLVEARFPKTRKNSAGYALNHFAESGDELDRSEEHTSELQSRLHLVCRLLLEKKKKKHYYCSFCTSKVLTAKNFLMKSDDHLVNWHIE